MDLSCLKGGDWFLPIICVFSRYCVAVTVNDKSARSIFSALYKNWICSFGPPKEAILTDNRREFDNDMLQEFCEKLNLNTITTALYFPFSNGIFERNNLVLKECSYKVKTEHPDLDHDPALAVSCASHRHTSANSIRLKSGVH